MLALWMVLVAVLPQLHQTLARHHHLYDQERGCFEDILNDESGAKDDTPAPHETARLDANPHDARIVFHSCELSNLVIAQITCAAPDVSLSHYAIEAAVPARAAITVPQKKPVLSAPKHSPPSA